MQRRSFIKTSCTLCAALSTGWVMSTLSSCAPAVIYNTLISENKISVPLSLFEKTKLQIVRAKEYPYAIAVRKETDGNFIALLMRCTHADNPLTNIGNGFNCSLHGSVFDKDGIVKKGPAANPLKNFNTEIISDQLIIHLN